MGVARLVRLVPYWLWAAAAALLILPAYFRYFVYVLGSCAAETFMPRT